MGFVGFCVLLLQKYFGFLSGLLGCFWGAWKEGLEGRAGGRAGGIGGAGGAGGTGGAGGAGEAENWRGWRGLLACWRPGTGLAAGFFWNLLDFSSHFLNPKPETLNPKPYQDKKKFYVAILGIGSFCCDSLEGTKLSPFFSDLRGGTYQGMVCLLHVRPAVGPLLAVADRATGLGGSF